MKLGMKKGIALLAMSAMTLTTLAGCSADRTSSKETKDAPATSEASTATAADSSEAEQGNSLSGVSISLLNSKGEIQTGLEEMAAEFENETGIKVDILVCGAGEEPYTKITSMYNSGTAPTMAMLDGTDIVALAKEDALDLSNEKWIEECPEQVTNVEGKVYSFPVCIEGRGLIYNKAAIEKTLGTTFDPSTINSYDSLKNLLEQLRTKGMENPVVISKEDWSLGSHQLGYIYDTCDGTTAGSAELINKFKSDELDPINYERFNQFIDTMDLLLQYNINGQDPLGALYEQDPIFLADGEAAIWANGSWAWPNLKEAGASDSDEYGFLPFVLGNDTADFANTFMQAAPTKQIMIDKVQSSEEQQEAAKEFINWIVYNVTGQKMLVELGIIPACNNNMVEPIDPLCKDIKTKLTEGKTYNSSYVAPSDHWSVMGAAMQKYIAKQSTKEELAESLKEYWTSQK